jgi:polar amino acid transport system permease protein
MAFLDLIIGPDGWGNLLMQGAAVTVAIAVTTVPFGFGGGLLLAVMKGSKSRVVRGCCDAFTTFFRGIPDLLSLFIVYFGLQALLDKLSRQFGDDVHIEVSAFVAGVIALSVVAAAYSSEVWVAAIGSVPKGQIEASLSLGLTGRQTFRRVVLPQLFRIALPGLGNIWTILLKDTSLISTLAVMDLLRAAFEAARFTREPLIFLPIAAGIYLIISIISAVVQSLLERRSNRAYA